MPTIINDYRCEEYDDNFIIDTDEKSLKHLFDKIKKSTTFRILNQNLLAVELSNILYCISLS